MKQTIERKHKLFSESTIRAATPYYPLSLPPSHPSSHNSSDQISQQSFSYEYLQFMSPHPYHQDLKEKLKYLYVLYIEVCNRGGFISCVANRQLDEVIVELCKQIPTVSKYSSFIIFEHYKLYLFEFQVVMKLNTKISGILLSHYGMVSKISAKSLSQKQSINTTIDDIMLAQDFCTFFQIDSEMCSLQSLFSYYKHQNLEPIKLHLQKQFLVVSPGIYKAQNTRTIQTSFQELCQLFHNQSNELLKTFKISQQDIVTCFKFDPKDQFLQQQLFGLLKNASIKYKGKYDLLSYSDQDAAGITVPAFTILSNKSRKGPSQQPLGICKVDVNMGADAVIWYCVPQKDIEKLRKILHLEYHFDLMKMEGEWWADIDWMILHQINIKSTLQKKNQAIIIGSGSLYWYQSLGSSVHQSWNFIPKSPQQHKISFKRCQINKQLSQNPTKIPLKSLTLRYLNHELPLNLPVSSDSIYRLMKNSLSTWLNEQQKYLNQLIIRCNIGCQKIQYYKIFDSESFCVECKQEILLYFVRHYSNLVHGISCLECFNKGLLKLSKQNKIYQNFANTSGIEKKSRILFHRYDQFTLYKLINSFGKTRSSAFLQNNTNFVYQPEFNQLCDGQYIGQLEDKCIKMLENKLVSEEKKNQVYQIIEDQDEFNKYISAVQNEGLNQLEKGRREYLQNLIGSSSDEQQQVGKSKLSQTKKKIDVQIQTDYIQLQQNQGSEAKYVKCEPMKSISFPIATTQPRINSEMIDENEERTKATTHIGQKFRKFREYQNSSRIEQKQKKQQQEIQQKQEKGELGQILNKLMMQSGHYDSKEYSRSEKSEASPNRSHRKYKGLKIKRQESYGMQTESQTQQNAKILQKSQFISKKWISKFSHPKVSSVSRHNSRKKKKFSNPHTFNFKL